MRFPAWYLYFLFMLLRISRLIVDCVYFNVCEDKYRTAFPDISTNVATSSPISRTWKILVWVAKTLNVLSRISSHKSENENFCRTQFHENLLSNTVTGTESARLTITRLFIWELPLSLLRTILKENQLLCFPSPSTVRISILSASSFRCICSLQFCKTSGKCSWIQIFVLKLNLVIQCSCGSYTGKNSFQYCLPNI